jgi:hypothetical protein
LRPPRGQPQACGKDFRLENLRLQRQASRIADFKPPDMFEESDFHQEIFGPRRHPSQLKSMVEIAKSQGHRMSGSHSIALKKFSDLSGVLSAFICFTPELNQNIC